MAPTLLSSVEMGDLTLRNRVAMAPMTRGRSDGETPDNWAATATMAEYYAQRSSAGLIIAEGASTSKQAIGWWRAPGVYTDKHAVAWRAVTDAVHAKRGLIFCQLWHTGRASHSSFRTEAGDGRGVAPSAVGLGDEHKLSYAPAGRVDYEVPRALTTEEAEAIPGEFKKAAQVAKDAGFDGVEIHSANGYLLDEFLQSLTNKRTDKYGGSKEKRTQLLLEVVDAVLEVWPANRVGLRISPNGMFNGMGSEDYREQFLYVAEQLNKYNLAYLHIMNGLAFGFHKLGEPMQLQEFRKVYDGVIMANCGYTQETAEKDVADGNCDIVSFGRPYISNPDLVERFEKGAELAPVPGHNAFFSLPNTNLGAKGLTDYPTASV